MSDEGNIIHDRIAKKAYEIWQQTGNNDAFANWHQAEYELGFAFHHQVIAYHAHFAKWMDKGPKKDDTAYWYEALNELRRPFLTWTPEYNYYDCEHDPDY